MNCRRLRLKSFTRSPVSTLLVVCTMLILMSATVATAEDNVSHSVSRALHKLIGEQILGSHNQGLARQIASGEPEERYRRLQDWILPNDYRDTIRLPVSLNTTDGVQSPVLDLVSLAATFNDTDELSTRIKQAGQRPANARAAAAMLFLAKLAVNQDAPTPQAIAALESFAAQPESRKVSVDTPDWPALLVLSQTAGMQSFEPLATELLGHYFALRGSQFLDDPAKDAFFDHIRWLDGRHTFATKHGGKPEQFATPPKLKNWITAEFKSAGTRGRGAPKPHWQITEDGVTKLGGHDMDYLLHRQPLHGNYQVEFEASANNTSVVLAGVCIEFNRTSLKYDILQNGTATTVELDPPLSKPKNWDHFRAVVQDNVLQAMINGRHVLTVALPAQNASWFGIRSWRRWRGTIRNFRISGDPVVPSQICISGNASRNWTSYFNSGNWFVASDPHSNGSLAKTDTISGSQKNKLAGTSVQNLFRYLRPMAEDGSIAYEFYYQDGTMLVHPALDRLCCVLTPTGIGTHTLTDQLRDKTDADPAGLNFTNTEDSVTPLPLIDNAWNRMQVEVNGDVLRLILNGTRVFTTDIPQENDRTFGLFHYADRTVAKIRNVIWHGGWPKDIPAPETQQIRNVLLDEINQQSSELPASFHHDFANGVPNDLFDDVAIRTAGKAVIIQQVESGVRILRDEISGEYEIQANLQVQGNFDIQARFSDLLIQKTDKGRAGVGLYLKFESESLDDCGIYRRHQDTKNESSQRLQQAQKWMGQDGRTKFRGADFPEESNAGCLRLVRRDREVYFMYAESDSENFRIINKVEITDSDTRPNGISLIIQAMGTNQTTATWESLSIRAESFGNYWPDETLTTDIIRRLDERRKKLTPTILDLTDPLTVAEQISGFTDETHRSLTDAGMRVTTINNKEFPRVQKPIEQCLDVEAVVDIHQVDAPPVSGSHNEVAILLYTTSEYLNYASIMLRRKAHGSAEVFCQTRESHIGNKYKYWPLRSVSVTQLKRMRLAIMDDTLYYLYSETLDGPYKLLAEHHLRDDAKPRIMYLRSESNGEGSTVDVTWNSASLFESESEPAEAPEPAAIRSLLE